MTNERIGSKSKSIDFISQFPFLALTRLSLLIELIKVYWSGTLMKKIQKIQKISFFSFQLSYSINYCHFPELNQCWNFIYLKLIVHPTVMSITFKNSNFLVDESSIHFIYCCWQKKNKRKNCLSKNFLSIISWNIFSSNKV